MGVAKYFELCLQWVKSVQRLEVTESMLRVIVETDENWFTRAGVRQRSRHKLIVQLLQTYITVNAKQYSFIHSLIFICSKITL